ncbi:M1 family metallopeptidase [bacterium]|nr:M1 family metallopeptidase [bacterium]
MNHRIVALFLVFTSFLVSPLAAQQHLERFNAIDVESYDFSLQIQDENNIIQGQALVTIQFKTEQEAVVLDLANVNDEGRGMTVQRVEALGTGPAKFQHENDQLTIRFNGEAGQKVTFAITYSGEPANGLVIAENKFGDRTFFGDNWPNRAFHWLPTVDHPSDKAEVSWAITAPNHYQVVANGHLVEETDLNDTTRITRWKTDVPLATKVMVFGAARFAVEQVGEIYNVPVSSWVYPQNRDEGFYDYEMALGIVDWFINHVGPYPYAKLANVQSKTMFGGMENAGNIFYFEGSVSGKRQIEGLLAHEIAHQWFGNSASESSWHHSWLSEGFATYFTNLYMEQKHGRDRFVEGEIQQRNAVIAYSKREYVPLVNPAITDYMKVLSTNTYQKGGWVLHMLRKKLGDDLFWEGIRTYYATYTHSNAYSDDLRQVLEDVSGQSLEAFFDQWVYQAGHPELRATWSYTGETLTISVLQTRANTFDFPLEVDVVFEDGTVERRTIEVKGQSTSFKAIMDQKPTEIVLDPDTWLLFEGSISEK